MPILKMGDEFTSNDGLTEEKQTTTNEEKLVNEEELTEPEDELIPLVDETSEEEVEEKETPEDASTLEKPDAEPDSVGEETPETNKEEEESVDTPDKELEGRKKEKDKLLVDIVELRKEKRELKKEPDAPLMKEDVDLSDVSESDIALIDKVLKAKGYVQKEELNTFTYKEKIDSYTDQWLEAHPEYLPENDVDDKNWDALQKEFKTFYKDPSNPALLPKILDKIHNELNPKTPLPVKSSAQTKANKEKLTASSKTSGGGESKATKPKNNIPQGVNRSMYEGFSDKEFEEMGL